MSSEIQGYEVQQLTPEGTMNHENWGCPKCDNQEFETGEFRATGGAFAKIFDVQNKKFSTVSCTQCGYTEIYKRTSSTLGNVFDFFAGG